MPPPPTPWSALTAINMPMFWLTAHNSDPTQKMPTAISMMGFRPQISEIFPHMGAMAALASMYADPIHVYPTVLLNSWAIVGIATVTMVISSAARNRALDKAVMMRAVSALVRCCSGADWAS